MKKTFARLWKENIKAFVESYGREPSYSELVAIRKFVITETALVLALREAK